MNNVIKLIFKKCAGRTMAYQECETDIDRAENIYQVWNKHKNFITADEEDLFFALKTVINERNQNKSSFPKKKVSIDCSIKPDDWLVVELGQSPVHCLWFCNLYNMKTKEQVWVEEYDTAQEAFHGAVKNIHKKEFISNDTK